VAEGHVLDVMARDGVDVVADLGTGAGVPDGVYDCFICTQTLHLVRDLSAACANAIRLLAPGGVLLATFPIVSPIARPDDGGDAWADHWRITAPAARALFAPHVSGGTLDVREHGNVRTAAAFLYGLAAEDLGAEDFGHDDPHVPMLVTVRAQRAAPY
jgi:SAM-dependent methyltransferase